MSANSGEIFKEYRSVLSVDPLNEDALIGKGICLIQAGNKDEAVAVLTKVIESGKENKQMARELINSIKGGQYDVSSSPKKNVIMKQIMIILAHIITIVNLGCFSPLIL